MECVKIKRELENIRDANREFGKEITEIEIKNFVDKFKDVVEEKIAREIFLKFFENNFEDDRKSKEINSMKRIKLSKKCLKEYGKLNVYSSNCTGTRLSDESKKALRQDSVV